MVTFVIYFTAWYAHQATLSLHETDISTRACAMMNSWYSAQMHEMLPALSIGFLTRTPDNRISINNTQLANTIRTPVSQKDLLSDDPATLVRACQIIAKQVPQPSFPYRKPTFAYISLWLSEVGAPSDLAAILYHTDNHLHPTWLNGGLCYLRCDVGANNDTDGIWTFMDPLSSNAAIGYARLNVPDGQKWCGSIRG
jgi:hypothetical protein